MHRLYRKEGTISISIFLEALFFSLLAENPSHKASGNMALWVMVFIPHDGVVPARGGNNIWILLERETDNG
jgi:hypothetical protein